MDSLNAISRWDAKRTQAFKKAASQQPKKLLFLQRPKVNFRTRPGEIKREDFASWMGELTPQAGAVNEFRTKMMQSSLRGLQNSIAVNRPPQHPGWALWNPATYHSPQQQVLDAPAMRVAMRSVDKDQVVERRLHAGIEPFFINRTPEVTPRGSIMTGGALSQLSRSKGLTAKMSDTYADLAKEQARQKTVFRSGAIAAPTAPPILTALDEAKLQIGTSLETIAQQLLRGIYSSDILRDLTTLSVSVARNSPLMDANALNELRRYLDDLLSAMRAGAKNTGKEVAEDNLLEFAEEPEFYGDTWRSFLGNPEARASQAEARDLDRGVKQAEQMSAAIYQRVEALANFINKQFVAAERPLAERIQIARAALPSLGTNIDRKTYPVDLKKRFEKEERESVQKQQEGDLLDLAEDQPVEMAEAMGFATNALPGGDLPEGFRELPTLRIEDIGPERAAGFEEIDAMADALRDPRSESLRMQMEDLLVDAEAAAQRGDVAEERDVVRAAFEIAVELNDRDAQKSIKRAAKARGFNPDVRVIAPEEGVEAAPAALEAAPEEEAAVVPRRQVRGEEMVPPEAPAPLGLERAPAGAARVLLTRDQISEIFSLLQKDAGVDRLTRSTKIPRKGPAIEFINTNILSVNGRRKVTRTDSDITVNALFNQLKDKGIGVETPAGEFIGLNDLL